MRDVYYKVITNYNKKKVVVIPGKSPVKLSSLELLTLRLLTHDYSEKQIIDFLDLTESSYNSTIKRIKNTLITVSMFDAQLKTFDSGMLKKEDYLPQLVKDEALVYSKIITEKIKEEVVSKEQLNGLIFLFLNSCKYNFLKNHTVNLSEEELKILKLSYKRTPKKHIQQELNISRTRLMTLKTEILNKLQVNHWCNVYKRALELQLLGSKSSENTINLDSEIVVHTSNMIAEHSSKNLLDKEKELAVYHSLLNFYATLEFNFLSQAE